MGCSNVRSIHPVAQEDEQIPASDNRKLVQQSLAIYFISARSPSSPQQNPLKNPTPNIGQLSNPSFPEEASVNLAEPTTSRNNIGKNNQVENPKQKSPSNSNKVKKYPLDKNKEGSMKGKDLKEEKSVSGHISSKGKLPSKVDQHSVQANSDLKPTSIEKQKTYLPATKVKKFKSAQTGPYRGIIKQSPPEDIEEVNFESVDQSDQQNEEKAEEPVIDEFYNDAGNLVKELERNNYEENEGDEENEEIEEDSSEQNKTISQVNQSRNHQNDDRDRFKERQSYNPRMNREREAERVTERISYRSRGREDPRLTYLKMEANVVKVGELNETIKPQGGENKDLNLSISKGSLYKYKGKDNSLYFEDPDKYSQFQEKYRAQFSPGTRTPANILESLDKNMSNGKKTVKEPDLEMNHKNGSVKSYKHPLKSNRLITKNVEPLEKNHQNGTNSNLQEGNKIIQNRQGILKRLQSERIVKEDEGMASPRTMKESEEFSNDKNNQSFSKYSCSTRKEMVSNTNRN